MRWKKGFTIVELVVVLIIVSISAGVFYGLIDKMFEAANFIMGGKESYQQARAALNQMANEIQYNVRGGGQYNFATGNIQDDPNNPGSPDDPPQWQYTPSYPCTTAQFTFMPLTAPNFMPYQGGSAEPNLNQRIRFYWSGAAIPSLPARYYLRREQYDTVGNPPTSVSATPTVTVLAGVKGATRGNLEIRYYDGSGNLIPIGASLTDAQAQTVGRIELLLTVNQWGRPVILSETIFVRRKGREYLENSYD